MKPYNAPNQSALAYRLGTHPTFLQRMRDHLASQTVPPNGGSEPPNDRSERPLTALTTRDSDDPALALLDAWAMVGDVLTFYTERIANEGFLRTATELRSVVALANTIGYQLLPGVAASTSLAFAVEAADASGVVTLPAGIQVQSIPGPGQVPQTFETIAEIVARPEWNALLPDRSPELIRQTIDDLTTELRLAGTSTGLQPGDKLLIISQHSGENKWYVVVLQTIEPNTADDYTTVTWNQGLAKNPSGLLASANPPDEPQLFAFRQQATLFGADAPRWEDMPDDVKREVSGMQSGLYQYPVAGGNWTKIEFTKPYLEFQALAAHSRDETHYHLFAGTATDGVFRSTDGGVTWVACNTGLSNLAVNSLCSHNIILYAGTTDGTIFRSLDDGQNWEQFSTGSIVERVMAGGQVTEIRLVADGLPRMAVHALTANDTTLYAGTDIGVYQSTNNGVTWSLVTGGESISAVRALGVKGSDIYAGTSQGLFHGDLTENPFNWTSVSDTNLQNVPIHALATDGDGTSIWAATDHGIYQSGDGTAWTLITALPNNQSASALALSNNHLLATTPSTNPIADEWPGFALTEPQLDLDTVYENLLADSYVLLVNGEEVRPYFVTGVTTEQRDGFTLHQKITRLALESGDGLEAFGGASYRGTELWLQSEQLALFEEMRPRTAPVEGDRIPLGGWVTPLQPRQRVVVSGKRIRVRIVEENTLVAADGSEKPLAKGDVLQLMSPPKVVDDQTEWTLKEQTGFIGVLTIEAGSQQLVYELAAEGDEVVSELHFVKGMEGDRSHSVIVLRDPLENLYDANTVTIQANVAQATHGETVLDEVLGSGDGSKTNQRFRLQKPPLTYVPARTERGIESTLKVRVNGIEWQEVATFNQQGGRSQCYIVRQDSTGQAYVIFGDGKKGARLASGQENVVATYRSGIGLAGEVEANTLLMLQTSPLGLLDVSNPLPARGAANPETRQETGQNAPRTVLTMDRVVSLSDYEDFARTFAGIGKVQAALLWTNQGSLIQLTIADTNGDAVEKGSALYDHLLAAINQRRNRLQQIQIDSYEPLLFQLTATLFYDSRYDAEAVEEAVRTVLLDTFSFQKRAFAQEVAASEVIAVMQGVAGVIAVDLDELHFTKQGEELKELLPAEPAFWNQEEALVHPAQLLLIDSSNEESISLTLQES